VLKKGIDEERIAMAHVGADLERFSLGLVSPGKKG